MPALYSSTNWLVWDPEGGEEAAALKAELKCVTVEPVAPHLQDAQLKQFQEGAGPSNSPVTVHNTLHWLKLRIWAWTLGDLAETLARPTARLLVASCTSPPRALPESTPGRR